MVHEKVAGKAFSRCHVAWLFSDMLGRRFLVDRDYNDKFLS